MNILITGGCGFLGARLARTLLAQASLSVAGRPSQGSNPVTNSDRQVPGRETAVGRPHSGAIANHAEDPDRMVAELRQLATTGAGADIGPLRVCGTVASGKMKRRGRRRAVSNLRVRLSSRVQRRRARRSPALCRCRRSRIHPW